MSSVELLPVGRVSGRRGVSGEMTVRVGAGDADWWDAVEEVWIGADEASATSHLVERARSYRDRLVLKLEGVDDAGGAEGLRGCSVWVRRDQAPVQPEGRWYSAALVGLLVEDERHGALGIVTDVMPTGGGADLLVVAPSEGGDDILVPLADEIVLEVDEVNRRIRARVPDGLVELNR